MAMIRYGYDLWKNSASTNSAWYQNQLSPFLAGLLFSTDTLFFPWTLDCTIIAGSWFQIGGIGMGSWPQASSLFPLSQRHQQEFAQVGVQSGVLLHHWQHGHDILRRILAVINGPFSPKNLLASAHNKESQVFKYNSTVYFLFELRVLAYPCKIWAQLTHIWFQSAQGQETS